MEGYRRKKSINMYMHIIQNMKIMVGLYLSFHLLKQTKNHMKMKYIANYIIATYLNGMDLYHFYLNGKTISYLFY